MTLEKPQTYIIIPVAQRPWGTVQNVDTDSQQPIVELNVPGPIQRQWSE